VKQRTPWCIVGNLVGAARCLDGDELIGSVSEFLFIFG
jgi:hypothetical protein